MFEKTSCYHPDKVADRIAGAIVDHCYTHAAGGWLKSNPRVAVETLIGHTEGLVLIETSEPLRVQDVSDTVRRISGLEKPNMFVYGGGDDVAEWCKQHDVVHVKEFINRNTSKNKTEE